MPRTKKLVQEDASDTCPSTPLKRTTKIEQSEAYIVSPSPSLREPITDSAISSSPSRKLVFGRSADTLNPANRLTVPDSAKLVYKVLNKATGSLGGNGYNGAIYGELTIGSMQKVINVLKNKCRLTSKSRFIDVGAGLGKPNFHVAQDPLVRLSIGIELEDIRYQLSMQNLSCVLKDKNTVSPTYKENLEATEVESIVKVPSTPPKKGKGKGKGKKGDGDEEHKGGDKVVAEGKPEVNEVTPVPSKDVEVHCPVNFICSDIDVASTLDPFTHIYMYDLGFPPDLQRSIANKFNTSVHATHLVSYRPPRRVIEEYGYQVKSLCSVNTSMFGSGENHTAYFYERIMPTPMPTATSPLLHLPGRGHMQEEGVDVACDPLFYDACILASGGRVGTSAGKDVPEKEETDEEDLAAYAERVCKAFMNKGREKRERKARQIV